MAADDLTIITVPQLDRRLGRQAVLDRRSFAFPAEADTGPLRTVRHRMYGPKTNPDQPRGNCTGCMICVVRNCKPSRLNGVTLDMDTADRVYSRATELDPWQGSWPPEDTGSSGNAACKAAREQGLITRWDNAFGIDHALRTLMLRPVGFGTWWYDGLFNPDLETGLVEPTGRKAGGHEWTGIAYDHRRQEVEGVCWWGPRWGMWRQGLPGRFRIKVDVLADLLADDGDVVVPIREG